MLLKRTILIGGGIVLVGALIIGTGAVSYVRTAAGYVKESVKDSIPVKFQIDRARQMIRDLEPTVKEHLHKIAKEEVQLERLSRQIKESQKLAHTEQATILRFKDDLESKNHVFRYVGRSYSRKEVETDLTSRFKRYKTSQATLENLQKIETIRKKSLEIAREKLEKLLAMRSELLLNIESLEVQQQSVDAAKMANRYVFDDSKLGRVKELVDDLQIRLDTESKMVNVAESLRGEIPVEEEEQTNISEQVANYFGLGKPDTETVAASE